MKKFILKTFYLSLPIIICIIIIEFGLRSIPNDYKYKKQYLDTHSEKIETLIFGSSHSYYGVNPEYFDTNTFNASHISQSIDFDYEILLKYQKRLINLKTVVLPISYFTLFGNLDTGTEAWRVKNYIIYYGIDKSRKRIDNSEFINNRIDISVKRLYNYYFLKEPTITCSKKGWGETYNSRNAVDLLTSGKTAAIRHTILNPLSENNQKTLQYNIQVLKSFINWCEKNKVNLLIFTPPAFDTYRQNLNSEQLKISESKIFESCKTHKTCMYINLLNDTNFIAQDYFDADHLSEIGAKKLSILINEKINNWE